MISVYLTFFVAFGRVAAQQAAPTVAVQADTEPWQVVAINSVSLRGTVKEGTPFEVNIETKKPKASQGNYFGSADQPSSVIVEMAAKLGVDIVRWRAMMLDPGIAGLVSTSSLSNENDDQTADFPGRPEARPDLICAREQMREVLEEAKKTLPERHQQVVALYYENEMTMTEIGQKIGVNASRVSQIHKTALEKMATALHSAGIHSAMALV